MTRKARALPGVLIGVLLAVALAFVLAGSAHNGDGTPVTFGHATGSVVHNADGSKDLNVKVTEPGTVDLTGKTSLVQTGTTTKFRVLGGQGIWNIKIWWDDSPAGSSYKVYQTSMWNPGTLYHAIYPYLYANNGQQRYMGLIQTDETKYEDDDFTGSSTTKADMDLAYGSSGQVNPSGCVYVIPTGGSETGSDCSV